MLVVGAVGNVKLFHKWVVNGKIVRVVISDGLMPPRGDEVLKYALPNGCYKLFALVDLESCSLFGE